MSKSYDDILNVPVSSQEGKKESFVEENKRNRTKCYELAEKMAVEITKNGENFQKYLDVQSQFDRYTPNNVLLIMAQKPEAKKLGDYSYWKEQGAYVKRKEYNSPILILEPGKEYQREDGSVGTYYNANKLYDISQTTLKEREENKSSIDDRTLVKALVYHPPVSIVSTEPENMPDGKGAYFDPDKACIYVRKGMGAHEIFKSLIPELVLADFAEGDRDYDRREDVFHSYCASYMLCKKYGIDTSNFDFRHAPEFFEGMDAKDVKWELSRVKEAMNTISSRMSKVLNAEKENSNKQQHSQERGSR